MSTVHSAIACFGVYFNTNDEAEAFLAENNVDYDSDGISGMYLGLDCLNGYTGRPWILGFEYTLGETLEKYHVAWDAKFPNASIKPEVFIDVRTY